MSRNKENEYENILYTLTETKKLLTLMYEKLNEQNSINQAKPLYYTSPQVMELLQISENTLTKLRRDGKIEFFPLSDSSYRYPVSQFNQRKAA